MAEYFYEKIIILNNTFSFSCSDATETSIEKIELDKCMNANISIIQNTNTERLKSFQKY